MEEETVKKQKKICSVVDPVVYKTDPNFYPSQISDPTTATKEICWSTFFQFLNITKLKKV
jgi:hypothetical protein